MLRYPSLHTSLGSTLGGSTVRIDEEGSSSATVNRWHLKSRRAYLVAATLVIIAAGSFLGAYAFHLFGSQTPNCWTRPPDAPNTAVFTRSEEHTSELQSRFDLVCRLLLEKK